MAKRAGVPEPSRALVAPADDTVGTVGTVGAPAADSRDALVPLPTVPDTSPWRRLADDISRAYLAERRARSFVAGKRSLLADSHLVAAVLQSIDEGLSLAQAGTRCGVKDDTVVSWSEQGERAPETSFGRFMAAAKSAREGRRARLLSTIGRASEAGPQYWTAAAWSLERGFGADYKLAVAGQTGGVIVQIGSSGPLQVSIRGESPIHNDDPGQPKRLNP